MMTDDVAPSMARKTSTLQLSHQLDATMEQVRQRCMDRTMTSEEQRDPQMVAAYMDDIVKHMREMELKRQPSPRYMENQKDLNAKMREILIDWLVEVHLKFKLKQETLFLTVNIIDRFLGMRAVSRSKLQLVGCSALLIASKYEEIYAPVVDDLYIVSDKAYSREQIISMESIILSVLKFDVTVPYPTRFAEKYMRFIQGGETFTSLVNFLIELTLQDYKALNFLPSVTAAAAISLALTLSGSPAWTHALQQYSGFSEHDIAPCVAHLRDLAGREIRSAFAADSALKQGLAQIDAAVAAGQLDHVSAAKARKDTTDKSEKLKFKTLAVRKKYSNRRYNSVAKMCYDHFHRVVSAEMGM
jgi:cyclin B